MNQQNERQIHNLITLRGTGSEIADFNIIHKYCLIPGMHWPRMYYGIDPCVDCGHDKECAEYNTKRNEKIED